MDATFQRALRPPRPVVFGLRMDPFTIGHLGLIERWDIWPTDLGLTLTCAFVCSQPWRRSERDLSRWWTPWFQGYWAWRCRKLNPFIEADGFRQYLSQSLSVPAIKLGRGYIREIVSPLYWRMLAFMMSLFHLTKAQALETPMIEATALYVSQLESDGRIELWSDADEAFWSFAREQDAKRAAARSN